MRDYIIPIFLAVLIGLSACNDSSTSKQPGDTAVHELQLDESPLQKDKPVNIEDGDIEDTNETVERKIVRNGNISFETGDIDKTKNELSGMVEQLGGYVSDEHLDDYNSRREYRLTVRISSGSFDSLISIITNKIGRLDSKNISDEDVTTEYLDIEARIRTKKDLEKRYTDLLAIANTVTEILEIEKQLGELRSDIESIEGRLNFLKNQISYSTLDIIFYQKISHSFRFGSRIVNALLEGWNGFLWFLVGIVQLWPFALVTAGGIYLFQRRKKNL